MQRHFGVGALSRANGFSENPREKRRVVGQIAKVDAFHFFCKVLHLLCFSGMVFLICSAIHFEPPNSLNCSRSSFGM